jgi:hypothetical protein
MPRCSAPPPCCKGLGVQKGDRVLIYMPMIAEAAFAMLACARIGAIHSVVFGGFASPCRWPRASKTQPPKLIISADAGSRGGKVVEYKPLLDEAIRHSSHKPQAVIMVNRGLAPMTMQAGRDHSWRGLSELHQGAQVPCEWLEHRHQLHHLHQRHHGQTQGRAARYRRLCGGAGREHEAHLHGQAGRNLFFHQRHRLGGGAQLHRLWPADCRHGHHHVRGPAHPPRRRHLVEPGGEVQGHHHVQRAHGRARAQEAGPGLPEKIRPVQPARCSWPASRWTNPRRAGSATPWGCPSSTTTGRPKAAGPS